MAKGEPEHEEGRGRHAEWPSQIPLRGWRDIMGRVWEEVFADRVQLVAAGVTFYLLLALFPALAAFVSLYGLIGNPGDVASKLGSLQGVLPGGALGIITDQLKSLASASNKSLGFGFAFGLIVALWSANSGVKSLFEAMNIAFEETEKRSFLKLTLISFAFTVGALVLGICLLLVVGVAPVLMNYLPAGNWTPTLIAILRWPILLVLVAIAVTLIYRFGPSRRAPKWRWLNWGAVTATIVWAVASWAFSYYLQNFGDYNATYGSLGAVVGLLMWLWISIIILIVGAELNSEIEHQTARDSTVGEPKPMGRRGAKMADTLGKSR